MAYAQWIAVHIEVSPVLDKIGIRNAYTSWGKFYNYPDKDQEVPPQYVSDIDATTDRPVWIASCGRENASSGTQGSFDCYHENKKIGTFRWDCPWASGTANRFIFMPASDEYNGQIIGGSVAGAIGELRLRLSKF